MCQGFRVATARRGATGAQAALSQGYEALPCCQGFRVATARRGATGTQAALSQGYGALPCCNKASVWPDHNVSATPTGRTSSVL